MSLPNAPGRLAHTEPNPRAKAERQTEGQHLHPKVLAREAAKVAADLDLRMSPARIRLLVRRFVSEGRSDLDFRTWFIAYADPTGETAVRNVMKAGG